MGGVSVSRPPATHSNGMSALQFEAQLGITYKTAWLLAQKLRRSMIDPQREPLEGGGRGRSRATLVCPHMLANASACSAATARSDDSGKNSGADWAGGGKFAVDSPLEEGVSCELVSENAKIPC
jgi:hypothetical protein